MAKIWVHVDSTVSADGDETSAALTKSVKKAIEDAINERTVGALEAPFSAKSSDAPKGAAKSYNAIKIVPTLTLKAESAGSKLSVDGKLSMVFEAIKAPKVTDGSLLGSAASSASVANRGKIDRDLVAFAEELLDALVEPLVKKVTTSSKFISLGKKMNLPL